MEDNHIVCSNQKLREIRRGAQHQFALEEDFFAAKKISLPTEKPKNPEKRHHFPTS